MLYKHEKHDGKQIKIIKQLRVQVKAQMISNQTLQSPERTDNIRLY